MYRDNSASDLFLFLVIKLLAPVHTIFYIGKVQCMNGRSLSLFICPESFYLGPLKVREVLCLDIIISNIKTTMVVILVLVLQIGSALG